MPYMLEVAAMTISILVEPSQAGFRATTGGPLDLSAEAASAAEAVTALQAEIDSRFKHGAILVHHAVPAPQAPIPLIPLAENPLFDSWQEAIQKYREEKEQQDRATYE
jgi:hypothetical protein